MNLRKTFLHSLLFIGLSSISIAAQAGQYPDLPIGIKSGGGALIGDTIYVGLGSGGDKFYQLNLKQTNSTWQEIAPFPGGERSQPVVTAVTGKLYVFGGLQKNAKGELQLVNDAYRYNPEDNSWQKLPTRSPFGLVGTTGVTHADKIYMIGGSNLSIFNGYFQDYVAAGEDQSKKEAVVNAYFNQRPQDYFFNTTLFSYQPATNQWQNEGYLPFSGRAGAAVTVKGDTITVVNGEIKPGLRTAKVEQGKFKSNGTIKWKDLPHLPSPAKGVVQDGLAGAYIGYSNGTLLVTGGANFPGSSQQFKRGQLFAHKGLNKAYHDEIYAFNGKKWKIVGKLPIKAGYGVSITYHDKILLIGGETTGGKALTTVKELRFNGKRAIVE
ncbi:N-acetylneuraminic acid mutarotase [Mergibacter septicus]|uniref:N-acetylneuraminate epimerase n=1 Tax=Mergibacter septicus TaxID=221402 RepID=UPI001C742F57|nr:N-acetylneuraminate epimerase [Mergibacter septicus]QDJ13500.1 N-acetylneuraminic acid mutarotase [Mergibacter septicus]